MSLIDTLKTSFDRARASLGYYFERSNKRTLRSGNGDNGVYFLKAYNFNDGKSVDLALLINQTPRFISMLTEGPEEYVCDVIELGKFSLLQARMLLWCFNEKQALESLLNDMGCDSVIENPAVRKLIESERKPVTHHLTQPPITPEHLLR